MRAPPASPWPADEAARKAVNGAGPRRVAIAAAALLVVVAGACTSAPGSSVLVADGGRFRVPLPEGWDSRAIDRGAWVDGTTVALISSQPLDPQCSAASAVASTASPGGCTAPLASLRPGALLAWWHTTTCAGSGCELPEGERLLVGGRQAVRVTGTHQCDALAATDEAAYLVTVTPQRVDAIVVCERNASEAVRSQLAGLLEHVQWRTP
jgi:hypothetical protein